MKSSYSVEHKDFEYEQKGTLTKKEVMPCAKNKAGKQYRQSAARRILRYAADLTNRLKSQTGGRLVKSGQSLTQTERERYGKSAMLRYVAGSDEPIYPIGYTQYSCAKGYPFKKCFYSESGREKYHENLRINVKLMLLLMRQPSYGRNIEFMDNRISLFSAQRGKCAVTGRAFRYLEEIHCHHKTPKSQGGGDEYANLILVWESVHKLIHSSNSEAIQKYLSILNLYRKQMATLNVLRKLASMPEIV